jgi:phosphoglycerate dehydrogenase-like enzyme
MDPERPPLVIQTEDLDPACVEWLGERCRLVRAGPNTPELGERLPEARGLVVRTYTTVNAELLDQAPNLEVVGRAGVALENVDVAACLARGVQVVNTPGSNTRAVVEFFNALLMDAVRPRLFLDEPVDAPRWNEIRREVVADRELNEMTLGIWGFGRIGSAVARLAAALDMRVVYNDLLEIPRGRRHGATPVPLGELLAASDILSVHVDYRASNAGILNAEACAALKPDALVINTSRGFVIDHHALAAWLGANPEARAMLDVHDPNEPIRADHPLLAVENAYLTPHLASGTRKAKRDMSWVVRDVWRVLCGEAPEHPPPAWLMEQARAALAASA